MEPTSPCAPLKFAKVLTHRGLPNFPSDRRRIVTTGTFDGVHLGHQALLKWMVEEAALQDAETIVLTFDPHPRQVLFGPDSGLQLIQSLNQRADKLSQTGLDHLVVQPFDTAFSRLRPEEFIRDVIVDGLATTTIVVGHDHRFGAGREGDVELLKACGETYGFDVQHIPPHIEGEITVSSTKIRKRLAEGDLDSAKKLLGRPHEWCGVVVHGEGRGRTLGFPTANLMATEPNQLLPGEGVYAANIRIIESDNTEKQNNRSPSYWSAMVHIGPRPTFDDAGSSVSVEAHVLEASSPNLYGKTLELQFVKRIREVRKFVSPEALISQLSADAEHARNILGHD